MMPSGPTEQAAESRAGRHDKSAQVKEAVYRLNDALTVVLSSIEQLRQQPLNEAALRVIAHAEQGTMEIVRVARDLAALEGLQRDDKAGLA